MASSRIGKHRRQLSDDPPSSSIALNFFLLFFPCLKANLEMNKEKLAAELVCLLDVASRPQDIAGFKQVMESFFIAGTARIDLIGKVMDLDNEIGGYSFDIPILIETQKAITDIGKAKGKN